MSVFAILDGAKFPKDTVEVCMRQDLYEQVKQLNKQLATATDNTSEEDQRLGRPRRGPSASEIEQEVYELEEQMRESVLTFHMQGVSTEEYNGFQRLAGRPRKDFKQDQQLGYNVDEMLRIAIKECTYKVTAPDGDEQKFKDDNWRTLWKSINDAQMDDLVACVQNINRRTVRVPSSARSSESQNGSEPKLQLPTDLASATNDSSAGNPEELQQWLNGQMTGDQSAG